jgi:hypothetical protein
MKIDILYLRVRRKARGRLLSLLELLQNEEVDKIEEALIAEGMKVLVSSYTSIGAKIPEGAYKAIAKEVVKCLNKINNRMQDRIRKSLD